MASGDDQLASLIVFEWNDEPLIGISRTDDADVSTFFDKSQYPEKVDRCFFADILV